MLSRIKILIPDPEAGVVVEIAAMFSAAVAIHPPGDRRNREIGVGGDKNVGDLECSNLLIKMSHLRLEMIRTVDRKIACEVVPRQEIRLRPGDVKCTYGPDNGCVADAENHALHAALLQ